VATKTGDLIFLWLRDHAQERRALSVKATEARALLKDQDSTYGRGIAAIAEAHQQAAEVYETAAKTLLRNNPKKD
jgi:hypothetical protein